MCIEDQIPFEIPSSWQWTRLGDLFYLIMGQSPKGESVTEYGRGIEFHQGKMHFDKKYIKHSTLVTSEPSKIAPANSVLLCVRAPVGKVNITKHEICIGRGLCSIIPLGNMLSDFVYYFLLNYESILTKQATGTTFIAVTAEVVKNQLFPVPPIQEQIRIVAKIEELIPHIDEYDAKESKINELNSTFPEQLKKSILQNAVQGKLVPQDSSDEPASTLLERIREEKARLVKEGKIKKDKNESVIFRRDNSYYEKSNGIERCIDKELPPFEIPDSWEWVRAGTLFQHNTGKALNASNRTGKLLDYITTSNLYWGRFELNSLKQMFFTESEIEKCTATTGDLLVCEGGDVGRAAIWNYDYDICIQNHVHKLRAYVPMSTKFFFYLFYFYKKAGLIGGRGIGIQGLSSNALHSLLFPLPPLMEQNRIVKEIEALFPLCGRLK